MYNETYYEKNKEQISERKKLYYYKNRERYLAYSRDYYQKHKEEAKLYHFNYYQENKEVAKLYQSIYRNEYYLLTEMNKVIENMAALNKKMDNFSLAEHTIEFIR